MSSLTFTALSALCHCKIMQKKIKFQTIQVCSISWLKHREKEKKSFVGIEVSTLNPRFVIYGHIEHGAKLPLSHSSHSDCGFPKAFS